jgi:hypothetical protein
VLLASSAAQALTASQTNMSWMATFDIECRAIGGGSLGLLFATGVALMNEAVEAPHMLIPATAPVVSAAVDLTRIEHGFGPGQALRIDRRDDAGAQGQVF